MNKSDLRPCLGGWLLIIGCALRVFHPIFRFLFHGGVLNGFRTILRLFLNEVIGGMPLRYISEIFGYSFLPNIIFALPLVALGVVLVIKKHGIPVAICCGCGVLVELVYPLLSTLLARWFGLMFIGATRFSFLNILYALSYVLLALTALISATPKSNSLKKFWWLAGSAYGALEFYAFIADIIDIIRHHAVNFRNISSIVITLFFGLIAAAGFIFAGQWLADPYRKQPAYRPVPQTPQGNYYQQPQYYQPPQPQYYQPQYQQPVQPKPVQPQPVQPKPAATISVVEELERAKGLLDSGAITQEEYDALKKRLLN